MHPRTIATLEQLKQAEWFSCVGVQDTAPEYAETLSSWYEAIESCSSPEWEDLCLLATNQYCQRLIERSPERYELWNNLVDEIKPIIETLVRERTQQVMRDNDLPKVFLDTVNWDILSVCMEAEYADVYPPGFYASQAYWYANGHFPCGWKGKFPEGKLVIF